MISLFDWIWIEIIAVTTAGAVAYCIVIARQEVQEELENLRAEVDHQRNRKKFWKAKAKGHKEAASVTDTPPIPMTTRRLSMGASGGRS